MYSKSNKAFKRSALVLAAFGLAACSVLNPADKTPDVIAAYSLFAPAADGGTLLYARVVVDGVDSPCPTLSGSNQSTVISSARGLRPDPANFPITVCEARIAPGISYQVSSSTLELAAASLAPSSVLIYGDSGCNPKTCKPGEAASPFARLAEDGAKAGAELILHMGDYNYRGTSGSLRNKPTKIYPYDAGDGGYAGPTCGYIDSPYYSQNASDSPHPDQWRYWYEDFFLPAKPLLPTAPWVFSRGNHELCSRAGLGWFYFFGPGSSINGGMPQLSCPNQGSLARPSNNAVNSIIMVQPYVLSLQPVDLWIMDSTNACDASADNPLTAQYTLQLNQLQQRLSSASKPVWMITHRPTWGAAVDTSQGPTPAIGSLNVMMQTAIKESEAPAIPAAVQLLLSGHLHLFQDVSFPNSTRPPQLIVGNSGVSLNKSATGNYQATIDGKAATINQLDGFGYMLMSLQADGSWKGSVLNATGQILVSCDSANIAADLALCAMRDLGE